MPERQEPVDDGDGRVGQIVRIAPRTSPRPRLAWGPWLRGFVIGALVGATIASAYFWWRLDRMAALAKPALVRDRR